MAKRRAPSKPKRATTCRAAKAVAATPAMKRAKAPAVVAASKDAGRRLDELLVRRAMQELRTEARKGPKKTAWAVDDAELYDAAIRYCLNGETQEQVVDEAKPDLDRARVSGRALVSWIVDVRKRYRELRKDVADEQLSRGLATMLGVEQVDQQHLIQTAVNDKVMKALEQIDLVEGDQKRIHMLTRMLEHGAEVAKIRADAALKEQQALLAEAKREQIVERMKSVADHVERGADAQGRQYSPEEIAQMIRVAAMGGDVKAHADRLQAKGAA